MNPVHKQIPVLIHKSRPICGSMVTVQYIDEVWNHKSPLLPSDPLQRAHAKFWADYVDKKIFGIVASKKELIECFKILEEELGDKPYFGGESFGYVDLSLIPCYSCFYTFETLGKLIMAEECPKIVDWAHRCLQKESVSKSLCDQRKFYETILEISRGGSTWSSADQLILLEWYPSSFAARVRIALAEKGLKYVSRPEDLINKSPLLLKMNPINKQIPVLIHNGRPICDSMVIVQYIDEVWNHKSPLLPSDSYQRAQAKFWPDSVDKKIYPIGRMLWATKGEVKEASKKDLIECFKILEGELGDKPYFGGERFGYIDLALIPFYSFFYTFETLGNFSVVVEFPKLVDWAQRCLLKESVSKSL
ncbi:hypothetical protein GH714_034796 [Hevea brasiliensis]|uniref:glutathione transferase n=1 Tax=Hevea brasiliensis TaxID=3981 RepID=A0A6A6NE32_HEVBR|nr:hypothetical protein GH714_034796 [Hevea brasiliensis]